MNLLMIQANNGQIQNGVGTVASNSSNASSTSSVVLVDDDDEDEGVATGESKFWPPPNKSQKI